MIDKLTAVALVVKDQNKAPDFYTKVLGMEKRSDFTGPGGGRWLTVAPKGQDIEISLAKFGSYPDGKGEQIFVEPGKGAQWTLQTSDCKKDFDELTSRGVKFDQSKPAEFPYGIQATFTDPDGNRFVMLQMATKQVW